MCTAASYRNGGLFFGRTLDNDLSYGEEVALAPRSFALWRGGGEHYAIVGMATIIRGLPLYYDGMNEKGLCMAGLNFAGNARYNRPRPDRKNVAQWELISYILGTCADVSEAEETLRAINLTDEPFSEDMPCAPLHWMISDGSRDIAVECTAAGMNIYADDAGVLTNNPPFEVQRFNLNNYMGLSAGQPVNTFSPAIGLKPYCFGMGAAGLPGDWSSASRFVRAAFVRNNYPAAEGEVALAEILGSVWLPKGCCRSEKGWERTIYLCCMSAKELSYGWREEGSLEFKKLSLSGKTEGDRVVRIPLNGG